MHTLLYIYTNHAAKFFSNKTVNSFSNTLLSMAMNHVVVALFLSLALAQAEVYTSQVFFGSVACLDCTHKPDLSGIKVVLKCDKVNNHTMAYTDNNGNFNAKLPTDESPTKADLCMARITGAPQQIYVSMKDSTVLVVESTEPGQFTTSKPLGFFYKACSVKGKCGRNDMVFGPSKTLDLVFPREWGMAPTSYYIPFFPIIGIP